MSQKVFATGVVAILALFAIHSCARAAADEIAATFNYSDAVATNVGVAGEFSNWNVLPMTEQGNGRWSKTLYLKPGHYGYKFVVNGDWKLDPNNTARKTVNDIENSAITVGNPPPAAEPAPASNSSVTFTHANPGAKTVQIAGEFNKWLDNVDGKVSGKPEWQMQNDGAGKWTFTTQLPPGRYKFKYVINGGEKWEQDSILPSSTDGNSIVEVKGPEHVPTGASPSVGKVTFTYADKTAKAVFLAGQFNNWSATSTPMRKNDIGVWAASIDLKPGRYQYKYVVDGDWRVDPANADSAKDSDGNVNSIKTVP